MKDNNKISIKFDLNTLDMFIMYVMLENNINVTKADLIDLQSLINNIKIDIYKNDVNLYARMIFIISVLKAKIDDRIHKKFLLLDYCKENMNELSLDVLEDQIIPMIDDEDSQLDESEILYIKKLIIKNLKYSYVYKYRDDVLELNTLLSDDTYNNINDINEKFENLTTAASKDILTVQLTNNTEREFDLFNKLDKEENIDNIIKEKSKKEFKLKTGYKYLNDMLGGGFNKSRVYGILGLTGGFKSGLLINLLVSMKMNNNYTSKNGLIPTILYITQENSAAETIERVFSCITAEDMANYKTEEVLNRLDEYGLNDKGSNINIKIKYIAPKSVNTNIFRTLYFKYLNQGYEIIAIIHDYIKTMKPVDNRGEVRYQMSDIVTEMKTIANELRIPIITVAQLNREAAKTIDSTSSATKADVTRMLGKANVGESWGMIEEFDWATVINKEHHDVLDKGFLVFKNIKARYLNPTVTYFAQPFDPEREFYLMEDINDEKPLGLLTMKTSINDLDNKQISGGKRNNVVERKELEIQKQYDKDADSSFSKFVEL